MNIISREFADGIAFFDSATDEELVFYSAITKRVRYYNTKKYVKTFNSIEIPLLDNIHIIRKIQDYVKNKEIQID